MRNHCHTCYKSVTSELPNDTVIRAVLTCPECIEAGNVRFPKETENELEHELLDLITLMPDTQTDMIIEYIMELRATRQRRSVMSYDNGQNIERIENNFKYHPPTSEQAERYHLIREGAKQLALLINKCTPSSREQSLAFTALEEVVYHANASIARNE